MGADYIGWRGCDLQRSLGREGFLEKLELRACRSVIEREVPAERRPAVRVRVLSGGGEQRDLAYPDLVSELGEFEGGIPDCATCPLAEGRPLGCSRAVRYPIDAAFERLLFEFFAAHVSVELSAAWRVHEDLIRTLPREHGPWHLLRGPREGSLAELVEPLSHEWIDARGAHAVDSALLCQVLFVRSPDLALLSTLARFWNELFRWLDARLYAQIRAGEARGADVLDSRTLREVEHVSDLLNASVQRAATEGWQILIEA